MNKKGSLSVEAVIGIMVLFLFCGFYFSLMQSLYVNEVINQGIFETAIETSTDASGLNFEYHQLSLKHLLMNEKLEKSLRNNTKYQLIKNKESYRVYSDFNVKTHQALIGIEYEDVFLKRVVDKSIKFKSMLRRSIPLDSVEERSVFITKTGEKYHQSGCFHLRLSQEKITLNDALNRGYTPCQHCHALQ